MSDRLESIFNECLERIFRGESVESCLRSYPQEAPQLEPLLRTALGFSWRASAIKPSPQFKARARAGMRYQAAQLGATQVQQPKHSGFFYWQHGWAVALTAILIFVFSGVGTAAASSNALPDEPLYSVKLATEELRLAFTVSEEKKAEIHAQLIETRATEIAAMTSQGKTEQVVATTDRLVQELEKADIAISRVERATTVTVSSTTAPEPTALPASTTQTPPAQETTPSVPAPTKTTEPGRTPTPVKVENKKVEQLNQTVVSSTSRSLEALKKALEQTPPKAQPALQRAIQTITEKEGRRLPHKPSTDNKTNDQEQEDVQDENKGHIKQPGQSENPPPVRNPETEKDRTENPVPPQNKTNSTQSQNEDTSADNTDNITQSATSQNQTSTQEPQQTIKRR